MARRGIRQQRRLAGLAAAAVIGVLSRSPTVGGAGAGGGARPRERPEGFTAVTCGLTNRHDTVIVRPRSL